MARNGPACRRTPRTLSDLPSYREAKVPTTRRMLTFVGNTLIFAQRVGKQMPRNFRRVRLSYLPDSRRELLAKTSNVSTRTLAL